GIHDRSVEAFSLGYRCTARVLAAWYCETHPRQIESHQERNLTMYNVLLQVFFHPYVWNSSQYRGNTPCAITFQNHNVFVVPSAELPIIYFPLSILLVWHLILLESFLLHDEFVRHSPRSELQGTRLRILHLL